MQVNKRTIFLVDDSKSNLVVGSNALAGLYKVFTLDSGFKLMKMIEKLTPDLILLDIEMPEMNGYEVLEWLKADSRFKSIPVIFLTALDTVDTELKGLTLGALDYITKPFSPPLLVKRIEMHLKLVDYSQNLEQMVEEQMKEASTFKRAVLRTTAELIEYRDESSANHIERTQQYIMALVNVMKKHGVYKKEVQALDMNLIMRSSELHEISKIFGKDSIKSGKLTFEEFEQMKEQTAQGEEIISKMKENIDDRKLLEYAKIFAISHHERWDGSGYPYGLSGTEIPLLGRMLAVADAYDALVIDKPDKTAFSHEVAVEIITEGMGSHFDPAMVYLFLEVNDEFKKISSAHSI